MSRYLITLLVAAACCAVQPEVQAQVNLPTVGISGARAADPPRVDVSRVCPDYGAQLQAHLSLPPVDEASEMLVRFQLVGGVVTQVGFRGAPVEFRNSIRRAMRGVDCSADGQTNQRFVFMLRHVPEGQGGPQAIALKADSPLLLLALND